jgi:hypothetical protein
MTTWTKAAADMYVSDCSRFVMVRSRRYLGTVARKGRTETTWSVNDLQAGHSIVAEGSTFSETKARFESKK